MRNRILLLSSAVLIAACADDQHPSAPASSRSIGGRSAAAGDMAATQGIGVPQAKPTDQVGFTQVAVYYGPSVNVAGGSFNVATVTCPAGSAPTGGGYELGGSGGTAPLVWRSHEKLSGPNIADGWAIAVDNTQAGATAISIQAWVSCAS